MFVMQLQDRGSPTLKMNFCRYEFSKNSQEELAEFIQIAKRAHENKRNYDRDDLWKLILPLKQEPHSGNTQESQHDKTRSVLEESNNTESALSDNAPLELPESSTDLEDLTDVILENLEVEKTLPNDILHKLSVECTQDDLKQIFCRISNHELDTESVYNFGVIISTVKGTNEVIVQKFFTHILFKRLTQKSALFEKLFLDIVDKFCDAIVTELSKNVYGLHADNLRVVSEYVGKLTIKCKNQLLRQFLCDHTTIHPKHLVMLISVISKETDLDILMKIVTVMVNIGDDCLNDTTYGKLLIKLIECLGVNTVQAEQHLQTIINKHKSAFKNRAKTTLDNHLQQQQQHSFLSQSFR